MDKAITILAAAISQARDGVPYDVKDGAACPFCGQRARVYVSKGWLGDSKLRYHKCGNFQCPICIIDESIRSWQEK